MLLFVKNIITSSLRLLSLLLKYVGFVAFVQMQLIYPIYATVNIAIINRSGSNTNTLNSANGVPIINIDKVNDNGQSFNEYDSFDVGQEGLIFNNSNTLSQTELAGWIPGNSNLQPNQSANLIVNTVHSKRSELGGYMEVAGNKADVIILNSNGIVCNGCGFLNTNRAILSTGSAIIDNGSFAGITVSKGEVVIGRGGLNAEKANRIDIISQTLRLNGQLRGKDVNVSLGGQNYNHLTGTFVANNIGGESYVISSSEFGGMYGDSIRLVSHNQSLGVNIDFNMATSGSKLEIDTAGNLIVSGKLSSAGTMNIKSSDVYITNTAELTSLSDLNLSGNSLNFSGILNSNSNLSLDFDNIYTLQGSFIQSTGDMTIIAKNMGKFEGDILGKSNILFKGNELNFLSNVSSNKNLKIEGNNINILTNSNISSYGDITFVSNTLDIFGKIVSSNKLELSSQDIYLQDGAIAQGKNVSIYATNLDLKSGSSITSMEDFLIILQGDFNLHENVQIASNRNFSMKADNINLYAGANLSANGNMNLVGNNLYVGIGNNVSKNDNKTTTISSIGNLNIDIENESNIQAKGNVTSKGLLTFRSSKLDNRGFIAGKDINFQVDYLNNLGHERIGNTYNSYNNAGVIYATNSIYIEGFNGGRAKHVLNSSSKIQTQNGDININADIFDNTISWWDFNENITDWNTIYENKYLGDDYEKDGKIRDYYYYYESQYERDVTYNLYGSSSSALISGGNLNITGGEFNNKSSTVSANGNIKIDVVDFNNETISKDNYKETNLYTYTTHKREEKRKHWYGGQWKPMWERTEDEKNTYSKQITGTVGLQTASISSGGNLSINADNSFNNGFSEGYQKVGKGDNIDYESGTKVKEQGFKFADSIDGNMFFIGDGTSGYLVETNPYFTDLQTFKGSAYYLNILGLNGNDLILGDGYADIEAVRKQVLEQTGGELLDGFTSQEEQLESLMDAGLAAKDELGLVVGEPLTDEQLKELKQPIIWWVSQDVNGQSVLVPQVFFPTDYQTPTTGGSTITSGGKVDVTVGGNANNDGTIKGDDGISINVGGDFNNNGNITNKDDSEYHIKQMEDLSNKIEGDVKVIEDLQKTYEEQVSNYEVKADEYKENSDLYTEKTQDYDNLLEQYNTLNSSIKNKYAGKVWTSDVKTSSQYKAISEDLDEIIAQLESLSTEIKELYDVLETQGESLNSQIESLNQQGEHINGLVESINQDMDSLEHYVDDTVTGVEITTDGNFSQNGTIEANKIIIDTKGKLDSVEGTMNGTFKTTINANEIELIGANIASSQVEMQAKDITLLAKENTNSNGYVNELVSTNIVGGSINLNSSGDLYISSSNIFGGTINLSATEDVTITGQFLEHQMSDEQLAKETIVYTDINTQEVVTGTVEEAQQKGKLKATGVMTESVGSNIVASDSLVITGENIGIFGSTLYSDGLLAIDANNYLEIGTLENITHIDYELKQKKKEKKRKWYKTTTTRTTIDDKGSSDTTQNIGSNIFGDSVYLGSGGDMDIIASNIANIDKSEEENQDKSQGQSQNQSQEQYTNNQESVTKNLDEASPKAWQGMGSGEIVINSGGNLSIKGAEDKKSYKLSTDIKVVETSTGLGTIVDNVENFGKATGNWVTSSAKFFMDPTAENYVNRVNSDLELLGAGAGLTNILTLSTTASITNTHSDYTQEETIYVGSNIAGDNIKINSGGDALIKGSNIVASNDVEINSTGNLNIEAGQNTFSSNKKIKASNDTITVSVGVGLGGLSGNASASHSNTKGKQNSSSTTYSGSTISAGNNANLTAKNDINILGSNIYGKNVSTNSENLNITSLQNEYYFSSTSKTAGFTAGVGKGLNSSGISKNLGANYSQGNNNSYNLVTENVAGIRASEHANINATNNVSLTGAVIEGKETVNINANTLIVQDLKDVSTSSSSNWGIGYTFSFGGEKEHLDNNLGFIGAVNQEINSLQSLEKYTPNIYVDYSLNKSKEVTATRGAINKVDNIQVENLQVQSINQGTTLKYTTYDYSDNINNIYTNTENNKEVVYSKTTNYTVHVNPNEVINNLISSLNVVKDTATFLSDYTPLGNSKFLVTDKEFTIIQLEILAVNQTLQEQLDKAYDYKIDFTGELEDNVYFVEEFLDDYNDRAKKSADLSEEKYTTYVTIDDALFNNLQDENMLINQEINQYNTTIITYTTDFSNQKVKDDQVSDVIVKMANGLNTVSFDYSNFRTHPDEADSCQVDCGNPGANRVRNGVLIEGDHTGVDIKSQPGDLVLANQSGIIVEIGKQANSTDTGDKADLKRIVIKFDYVPENPNDKEFIAKGDIYSSSVILYVDTASVSDLKRGDRVEAGDVLGYAQNTEPAYGSRTENHIHNEIGFKQYQKDSNNNLVLDEKGNKIRIYTPPDPTKVFDYPQTQQNINTRYEPLRASYKSVEEFNNRNNK